MIPTIILSNFTQHNKATNKSLNNNSYIIDKNIILEAI